MSDQPSAPPERPGPRGGLWEAPKPQARRDALLLVIVFVVVFVLLIAFLYSQLFPSNTGCYEIGPTGSRQSNCSPLPTFPQ